MLCPAGECDNVAGELAEAQATSAELSGERDKLAGSLANLEAEHANLLDAHSSLKCAETLKALYQTISSSVPDHQQLSLCAMICLCTRKWATGSKDTAVDMAVLSLLLEHHLDSSQGVPAD